jgi:hypothetical protein
MWSSLIAVIKKNYFHFQKFKYSVFTRTLSGLLSVIHASSIVLRYFDFPQSRYMWEIGELAPQLPVRFIGLAF